MEENREQPAVEPTNALNKASEERVASDAGSQELGKFKDANSLLEAYNNLQSEFTRKCQLLAELQKDKIDERTKSNDDFKNNYDENNKKNSEKTLKNEENSLKNRNFQIESKKQFNENEKSQVLKDEENLLDKNNVFDEFNENDIESQDYLQAFSQFLEKNKEAKDYADEIKEYLKSKEKRIKNPFENAWANIVLSHIKSNELNDSMVNQYILSNNDVKNKIIENYLNDLTNQKPPITISSQSGERVSRVFLDNPKTLAEAKKIVNNMFS